MARNYSQTKRPPTFLRTHKDHTFTTHSSYAHVPVRSTQTLQTCRKKYVISQYNFVGPITRKPKHRDSSCFPLFILCTRFIKIFVLCWCVHIAYVSIWCPVDIVVLNLDFTDLCRFYITCGLGEKGGGGWGGRELFVFYSGCSKPLIGRSIHLFLGTLQGSKMQMYSSEDEMVYNFVNSIFNQ